MLKFLKRPAESAEPQTEAKAARTDTGGGSSAEAPASSSAAAATAAAAPPPELPALAMLEHLDRESPWRGALAKEFSKSYMRDLDAKITQEREKKKVFPKPQDVFACLNFSPLTDVRVVILGQDPYHGPGQAHGFCFSVNYGIAIPPSLKNIYTELQTDAWQPRVLGAAGRAAAQRVAHGAAGRGELPRDLRLAGRPATAAPNPRASRAA